jgi:hypothetical protein
MGEGGILVCREGVGEMELRGDIQKYLARSLGFGISNIQ